MKYTNDTVLVELKSPHVALMTMNNPPLNVLTLKMCAEFQDTVEKLGQDDHVRVVVVTGQGKRAFGCGSDIKQMMQYEYAEIEGKISRENTAYNMMERMDKIFIAAIEGVACGGGLELALSCDMRIMAKTARVSLPEINLGLFPGGGGTMRLPKLIPPAKALEFMLTGDFWYAEECLGLGLVNRLALHGEAVAAALALGTRIAQKPFAAVKLIKKAVRELGHLDTESGFRQNVLFNRLLYQTDDAKEGIDAFLNRRPANFSETGGL